MEEIAHLQGALVFGDEVGEGFGEAIAPGQFQALIHMGLQDCRTAEGIIELVVGVAAFPLVFDEPLGRMQFADIVIQRAGAHQVHIRADGPGPFLSQPGNHQGVLKGSRGLARQTAQERTLQVGQFQQPGPGQQAEKGFDQGCHQEPSHQQASKQQGFAEQIHLGDGAAALQQQPLQRQGPTGEEHRQLQEFSAAALATGGDGGKGADQGCHQQARAHQGPHGEGPKQAGRSEPGEAAAGAEALGEQERCWDQQHQGAGQGAKPEAETANHPKPPKG